MQLDDVGVVELGHDGRLLEELDGVLERGAVFERLQGHIELRGAMLPRSQLHAAKLSRPQMLQDPAQKNFGKAMIK